MKNIVTISLLLILGACNNNTDKDTVKTADSANEARRDNNTKSNGEAPIIADKATADFLVKAYDGGMMEVSLGNLVAQKSQMPRVKGFGEMMVKDHSSANEQIRQLAAMRTVELPRGNSDEKMKMIDNISAKSGKESDKDYINMMVDDHKKDIDEFKSAANQVKDSAVQRFIRETIPVLQKHLDSCTAIQASMKKSR